MAVYALYFCLVVALALFIALLVALRQLIRKIKKFLNCSSVLRNWNGRLRELRLWALNDVTSSQIDVSSVSTSEQTDEYTMSAVIENQHTIINNQNITISYLGTICFLITISIGIYLVIKFGKWIYSLINY